MEKIMGRIVGRIMGRARLILSRLAGWASSFKRQTLKGRLLLIGGGFGLICVVGVSAYYGFALASVETGEIKLAELRRSFARDVICHEECARVRREDADSVVGELSDNPDSRLAVLVQKYFQEKIGEAESEKAPDEPFKVELIRILRQAYGPDNPPRYIRDYLADPNGFTEVKAAILGSFSVSALRPQEALSGNGSRATNGPAALDYYFALIAGNEEIGLQEAAVRALSDYPEKAGIFSAAQLTILKKVILNPETDRRLRQMLVPLLGDYYPLYPAETVPVLEEIYGESEAVDAVSRAFAADILIRQAGKNLLAPEVTEAEWNEYFND